MSSGGVLRFCSLRSIRRSPLRWLPLGVLLSFLLFDYGRDTARFLTQPKAQRPIDNVPARLTPEPWALPQLPLLRALVGHAEPAQKREPAAVCSNASLVGSSDINAWELYAKMPQLSTAAEPPWPPVKGGEKIRVFVVAHSHVDPGWLQTFEGYYISAVRGILDSAVAHLHATPTMRFIWSEISFLERWWREADADKRHKLQEIVSRGQLEICGGAWVMTDEATPYFWASIDNIIEGQRFVHSTLNVSGQTSWSVDPFGHGLTVPLLYQLSGIRRFVLGRVHTHIKRHLRTNKDLVFNWRQPWESSGGVLTTVLPNKVYITADGCGPDPKICCQFEWGPSNQYRCGAPAVIDDANVKKYGDLLAGEYRKLASLYPHRVLLVTLGSDFRFKQLEDFRANHDNYARLFRYFAEAHPDLEASFGTVSEYFAALEERVAKRTPHSLSGDFFPYTDNYPSATWVGYMSTRMHWKLIERRLQTLLRAAYVLLSFQGPTKRAAAALEVQSSSRDLALFQHHDGITGTSVNEAMADYKDRLLKAWRLLATKVASIVAAGPLLASEPDDAVKKPDFTATGEQTIKWVTVVNAASGERSSHVRLVIEDCKCAEVRSRGASVPAQVNPTLQDGRLSNNRIELEWVASLAPLGRRLFSIRCAPDCPASTTLATLSSPNATQELRVGYPDAAGLRVDPGSGLFTVWAWNEKAPINVRAAQEYSWAGTEAEGISASVWIFEGTTSGAYLLRPTKPATKVTLSPKTMIAWQGPLSAGISTVYAGGTINFATIRLHAGDPAVRVELQGNLGGHSSSELLLRFTCAQCKGSDPSFLADVNGLYLVHRRSVPGLRSEANFYPLAAAGALESTSGRRLNVLTGQPHAAWAPEAGALELLIERAINRDDGEGLSQVPAASPPSPTTYALLPERMPARAGGQERHESRQLSAAARRLQDQLLQPPLFFLSDKEPAGKDEDSSVLDFPCELELVTLKPLTDGQILLILRWLPGLECTAKPDPNCSSVSMEEAVISLLKELGVSTISECDLSGTRVEKAVSANSFHFQRMPKQPIQLNSYLLSN